MLKQFFIPVSLWPQIISIPATQGQAVRPTQPGEYRAIAGVDADGTLTVDEAAPGSITAGDGLTIVAIASTPDGGREVTVSNGSRAETMHFSAEEWSAIEGGTAIGVWPLHVTETGEGTWELEQPWIIAHPEAMIESAIEWRIGGVPQSTTLSLDATGVSGWADREIRLSFTTNYGHNLVSTVQDSVLYTPALISTNGGDKSLLRTESSEQGARRIFAQHCFKVLSPSTTYLQLAKLTSVTSMFILPDQSVTSPIEYASGVRSHTRQYIPPNAMQAGDVFNLFTAVDHDALVARFTGVVNNGTPTVSSTPAPSDDLMNISNITHITAQAAIAAYGYRMWAADDLELPDLALSANRAALIGSNGVMSVPWMANELMGREPIFATGSTLADWEAGTNFGVAGGAMNAEPFTVSANRQFVEIAE